MATETITIQALFRDSATEGINRLEGSLGRMGSRLSALNTEMNTRGQQALTGFKSNLTQLHGVIDDVGKKLDPVISKIGDKLWSATKLGIAGVVGLGVAFTVMAMNVEKEVQNATLTISNFMGGAAAGFGPTSPYITNLVDQMQRTSYIASVGAQTKGQQQLLVNPQYRQGEPVLNAAMLSIAAMSPGNSEAVYNQLITATGRMEAYGRVNTRMSQLLQRGGISQEDLAKQIGVAMGPTASPAAARAMAQVVANTMTVGQFQNYMIQEAVKRTGFNPAAPYAQSPTEQLMASQSITGAISYAKANIGTTLHESLGPTFAPAIVKMVQPIQTLVGTLATTVIPPVVNLLSSLVNVGNKLLPVIQPLLNAFSGGIAAAFGKLQPFVPMLQRVGSQFAKGVSSFLTAALPLMPAFLAALLALLQVLPPFLTLATPAMWAFSHLLEVLAKLLALVTSNSGVADTLAGIGAGLLVIAGAAKVLAVLEGIKKWMKEIEGAEGFWGKVRSATGIGQDKKGVQEVAKSTVAEMSVGVMKVGEMLGGGGGGLPGRGSKLPGEARKAEGAAGGAETAAEDTAAAAGGGGLLRKLFPTVFRAGGAVKGVATRGLGYLGDLKDTALLRGMYGVDALKGALGLGGEGGLLGTLGTGVGEAGAGAVAGTVGVGLAAGAAAFLGTTALLNAHKKGAERGIHDVASWATFGHLQLHGKDEGPKAHLTRQTSDFMHTFMKDHMHEIMANPELKKMHQQGNDWEILRFWNQHNQSFGAPPSGVAGGVGAAAEAGAIHIHGDVTVKANNPDEFSANLAKQARSQARRGARVPTTNGNQSQFNRIMAQRPTS